MERRLNISPKFIAVLAIVLALIIAVAAWMNRSSGSHKLNSAIAQA